MGKSAGDVRSEIEQNRREMSETIDALADRTSPRRIAERRRADLAARWTALREQLAARWTSVASTPEGRSRIAAGAAAAGTVILAAVVVRRRRRRRRRGGA